MSEQITPNPSVPSQVVQEVKFPQFVNNLGIIPTSYKDSMSYYETLAWLCKYLEETVIPTLNQNGNAVQELQGLYIELNSYVTNYFDNLDVQEEINHKLDMLVEDGTLNTLIGNYINPEIEQMNATLNSAITGQNTEIANIRTLVNSAVQSTPIVVSSTDSMTDTTKIYVNTTDGKWYYYNGTAWTIGGTYQSTGIGEDSIYLPNLNKKIFGNLFKLDGVKNYGTMVFQIKDTNITNVTSIKVKALVYVKEANIQGNTTNLLIRRLQSYDPTTGSSYSQYALQPEANITLAEAKENWKELTIDVDELSNVSLNAIDFRWNYYNVPNPLDIEWYTKDIRIWINNNEIGNIYMTSSFADYLVEDKSPDKGFIVSNEEYTLNNKKINDKIDETNELLEAVPTTLEEFMNEYDTTIKSNLHEISCFGDSLTQGGSPGKSYPVLLSELINNSNVHVNNLGVGGQCSGSISFRQGGNTLTALASFTIPASNLESVTFYATPSSGNAKNFSNVNDNFQVIIDGIEGTMNIDSVDSSLNKLTCSFTRSVAGNLKAITTDTVIYSKQDNHDYDVNLIWMGLNDVTFSQPYDVTGVIANYEAMIDYLKPTIKRFLVISPITTVNMTTGTSGNTNITAINSALETTYPNNFVDLETYLCTQCIYDMGITPTSEDIEKMEAGTIPPSLLYDGIHPTEATRHYIAKFIYDNMILKGWIL